MCLTQVKGEKPPAPTRGLSPGGGEAGDEDEEVEVHAVADDEE